jgi:hypothetical protein
LVKGLTNGVSSVIGGNHYSSAQGHELDGIAPGNGSSQESLSCAYLSFFNLLPYYEFGYFALYNFTAFGVIVMAFFGSIQMWELVEEREVGAAEGFLGRAISWGDAIKFMALGTAVMVTTYYAAYAIGETLDQSIEWFSTRDSRAEQANGCSGSNSGAECDNTPGASL